jgi:hypothetical protein
MTHFLFPRGRFFAESRLVRFAGETPSTPDTPPPAEAKTERQSATVDPKSAFRGAQERMKSSAAKLKQLQGKLDQIKKVQSTVGQDPDADAAHAEKLGLTDDEDNGFKDEIDDAVKTAEAEVKKASDDVNAATQESDQHLETIAAKGPGGKLDAAFMRMSATMNDPNASVGEKLSAVIVAFSEMQNLFKGVSSPAGAPGAKGGSGPEAEKSSPQGKKETVRQMMKDAGKDKISDLKTDRETKVTDLKRQKGALDGAVTTSKTSLANEQATLATAKSDLETNKEDPAKQNAVREAQVRVTVAEGTVKAAEEALASLNADLAKAEADVKTIKDVEDGGKESVDKFNAGRGAMSAALLSILEKVDDPDVSADLRIAHEALRGNNASLGENGIDLKFKIPMTTNAVEFQQSFIDQGITNTAEFGIDPRTNVVGNPDAMLKGIQQLIGKAEAKVAKPAAPPAPGGPAGA